MAQHFPGGSFAIDQKDPTADLLADGLLFIPCAYVRPRPNGFIKPAYPARPKFWLLCRGGTVELKIVPNRDVVGFDVNQPMR